MVETHDHFVERLQTLGRKHAKMTRGYTTKIGKDGLMTATPRRKTMPGTGVLKLLLLVGIGFFAFKSFTLAAYGPVTYNDRLSQLENGTIIEKAGARALAIDPLTAAVADKVGPVLR